MNVVIVGGGKVGINLCRDLEDRAEITLIDIDPRVVEEAFAEMDIQGFIGNGADVQVLSEAEVSTADVFIAVSESDEINIISAIIARKLGASYTIARVRKPAYYDSIDFIRESLELSGLINPEREAALEIAKSIKFPYVQDLEYFGEGRVIIAKYYVEGQEFFVGKTLTEFGQISPEKILIAIIERNDEIIIPTGNTQILSEDIIYATGEYYGLKSFFKNLSSDQRSINSCLIVGGGNVAHYLIESLGSKLFIKLIEINPVVANDFAAKFPHITVIQGDGTDQNLLLEEGIKSFDSVVALTGIDEENIMLSLFAKKVGVKKNITKVNRTPMLKLIDYMDLDSIITPSNLVSDEIVTFVRNLKAASDRSVEKLYKLADRKVEALEFNSCDSKILGIPLKDLNLKPGTLIISIVRPDGIIFPGGDDIIRKGDKVILVTEKEGMSSLDDCIEVVYD